MKKIIDDFVASIAYDIRLLPYDLEGSIAHCRMLEKCGIITGSELKKIIKGLQAILGDYNSGKITGAGYEDVHTAVERLLINKIGDTGGKMHTARSRNDQVSLDMKLYLRDAIKKILGLTGALKSAVRKAAGKNLGAIMPGFTHLQHAQPVLFSHHLMAYKAMLDRDEKRFKACLGLIDEMPLGAAALAGTGFDIDRKYVARLLGFKKITSNSMDTVSDRDFIVDFIAAAAILMMHLSRFSEDLILWNSQEFDFVKFGGDYVTGSSIMPQKRNPDTAELVRGKTGRVYGNLMGILTVMKGLPLTYNRDMQEDKQPLFDTVDTVVSVLKIFRGIIETLEINQKKMEAACSKGFITATDLADYLVKKGIPFRKAHTIVKGITAHCISRKKKLEDMSLADLKKFSGKFSADVSGALNLRKSVESRKSEGGTSSQEVRKQLKN